MNAQTPFVAEVRTSPLDDFVDALGRLLDVTADEAAILTGGTALLETLVARDDWLPDAFAVPDPARYRQYLLHLDPRGRFSVVSFVWGPGQATPIHDHRVWGLVGVLRGAELNQAYGRGEKGGLEPFGAAELLGPGGVGAVSPSVGDIHSVANAHGDRVSISIHVYGGDIGSIERATYDLSGRPKRFVSGYANAGSAR